MKCFLVSYWTEEIHSGHILGQGRIYADGERLPVDLGEAELLGERITEELHDRGELRLGLRAMVSGWSEFGA